jgi:hypothetical protein
MYSPMFVAAWFGTTSRWRSFAAVGFLLLAAIPVIHSLNRGMWLGLSLALIFTVIRFAIAGHTRPLNMVLIGVVVGTIGFLASPLYGLVTERLAHPHSNDRRGNLASEVTSTAWSSPFIGYGATRTKQGGYATIAAGDSSRCESCAAPALGTQGYVWLLLLGSGYVGTALCLMFLLSQFLSAVRKVTTTSMVACVTILMSLVFFTVYDSLGSALFTLMIAIGVHARAADRPVAEATRGRGRPRPRRGRDLAEHVAFVRRNAGLIGTLMIVGAVVGGGLSMTSPTSYAARTSVLINSAPVYVDTQGEHRPPSVTIDTDAQVFSSPFVARKVSARTGIPAGEIDSHLLIGAEPLTRVLTVTFQASTPEIARIGSQTATHAMLEERAEVIVAQSVRRLRAIRFSLGKLQNEQTRREVNGTIDESTQEIAERIVVLQALTSQLQEVGRSSGRVLDSAHVVRTERARAPTKWVGSGAGLGLLLALALAFFRPRPGWLTALRRRRSIPRVWDVSARGAR